MAKISIVWLHLQVTMQNQIMCLEFNLLPATE